MRNWQDDIRSYLRLFINDEQEISNVLSLVEGKLLKLGQDIYTAFMSEHLEDSRKEVTDLKNTRYQVMKKKWGLNVD